MEIEIGDKVRVENTGTGVPYMEHYTYAVVIEKFDQCRYLVDPEIGSSFICS